jgi:hypothetical protein
MKLILFAFTSESTLMEAPSFLRQNRVLRMILLMPMVDDEFFDTFPMPRAMLDLPAFQPKPDYATLTYAAAAYCAYAWRR